MIAAMWAFLAFAMLAVVMIVAVVSAAELWERRRVVIRSVATMKLPGETGWQDPTLGD